MIDRFVLIVGVWRFFGPRPQIDSVISITCFRLIGGAYCDVTLLAHTAPHDAETCLETTSFWAINVLRAILFRWAVLRRVSGATRTSLMWICVSLGVMSYERENQDSCRAHSQEKCRVELSDGKDPFRNLLTRIQRTFAHPPLTIDGCFDIHTPGPRAVRHHARVCAQEPRARSHFSPSTKHSHCPPMQVQQLDASLSNDADLRADASDFADVAVLG